MFTGIITDMGQVKSVADALDGKRLVIKTNLDLSKTAIGASISCSGACMTVVEKWTDNGEHWFGVDVSGESLAKTTMGTWGEGRIINLEPALKLGDELGGHIVTGHIDGLGVVKSADPVGESLKLDIEVGPDLARFIAPKGSVTIDGVSLTVNEISADGAKGESGSQIFSLNIIPHTSKMTTLGKLCSNDKVNVEIDTLARYVARLQDSQPEN